MKKASIQDRAMLVVANGAQVPSVAATVEQVLDKPKTAPGGMMSFLNRESEALKENAKLKLELADLAENAVTKKIDPTLINSSHWANRHEHSFDSKEFEELRAEIASAGGNVQPIKVRPSRDVPGTFELVFGHRRHRACLELGIDVLAMVEDLNDIDLFIQMDRENRSRASLTPFEYGTTYARALDEGLFSSARKLAEEVGLDISQLSKAVALAKLPAVVIAAFPSPLDLQYRWASLLTHAFQKDPELILSRAKEIRASSQQLNANQVLERLLHGEVQDKKETTRKIALKGDGGRTGEIKMDRAKGSATVSLSNLDPQKLKELEQIIKAFMA